MAKGRYTGGRTGSGSKGLTQRKMVFVKELGVELPIMSTVDDELREYIGCDKLAMQRMAASGEIPATKIRGRWMYPTLRVLQWAGLVA